VGVYTDISERKQAEEALRRRTEELRLLYEAGRELGRTLDLQEVRETLGELVAQVMPCDCLVVSSYDAEEQLIHCVYSLHEGKSLDVSTFPPIPLEAEGWGTQSVAIRSGEGLLIRDYDARIETSRTAYYVSDKGQVVEDVPEGEDRTRSALVVPLKLEGQVVGIVQVFSYHLDAYSEDDLRMLEALAQQLAAAGANALLYQQAQDEIAERKRVERERELMESQLRQAQKLEAVGVLAGGVAHEFNNMLTVIQGNAELAQMALEPSHPLQGELTAILQAARRSADLTQQLLAFGRRQMLRPRMLDVNEVIRKLVRMLQRIIGEHITLRLDLAVRLDTMWADVGALQQVLMNLVLNARDAMPDGGDLCLETAEISVDSAYCQSRPEAEPGKYVRVAVVDTGVGMDEATKEHLFEPFFTTKGVGEGSGLGLSVVYGLVREHGGWIEVESEVGKGTRFEVYLPLRGEDVGRKT
jgi:signal transduction histidine kinase